MRQHLRKRFLFTGNSHGFSFRIVDDYGRRAEGRTGNFKVETMRDGATVARAEVQAGSDVEAAKSVGPVTSPSGREPSIG